MHRRNARKRLHPNSLRNLRRPWRNGESGNPNGRKAGLVYVSERVNSLLACNYDGTPEYIKADLERIVDDRAEAPAKVIAAQRALNAMKSGERWVVDRRGKAHPAGTDPEPGRDFDRIADRTEGKPVQSVQVVQRRVRELDEIPADLATLLEKHLQLREMVASRLGPRRKLPGGADARAEVDG